MVQVIQKTLTLDEFLQLPETKPASEYIDGQIIQKPIPQGKHSIVQSELVPAINIVVKQKKIARAFPELRCTFGEREIIPALIRTFSNCQFIVTTHSPQVISQVKPQGIYILEKTDTGIIAKRPESSYGRDSNQILEDLMDVPERPQEIKQELLKLFRLIDAGNLEAAKELRKELAKKIGEDEAQFVKADILIRRKGSLRK